MSESYISLACQQAKKLRKKKMNPEEKTVIVMNSVDDIHGFPEKCYLEKLKITVVILKIIQAKLNTIRKN